MCGTGGLPFEVQSRLLAGRVDFRAASNSIPNSQVVFRHSIRSIPVVGKEVASVSSACRREGAAHARNHGIDIGFMTVTVPDSFLGWPPIF